MSEVIQMNLSGEVKLISVCKKIMSKHKSIFSPSGWGVRIVWTATKMRFRDYSWVYAQE